MTLWIARSMFRGNRNFSIVLYFHYPLFILILFAPFQLANFQIFVLFLNPSLGLQASSCFPIYSLPCRIKLDYHPHHFVLHIPQPIIKIIFIHDQLSSNVAHATQQQKDIGHEISSLACPKHPKPIVHCLIQFPISQFC